MAKPEVLLLAGYGINCEDETAYAFEYSGAKSRIVHVNDLIENRSMLNTCRILVFPGGFSYGDDTGSGLALANRIKNNLMDELLAYIERDTLVLGICNGFQVLVNLGLVPALKRDQSTAGNSADGTTGRVEAALVHNNTFRYQCRWVDLMIEKNSPSVFIRGIRRLHIPVAHGEGNFYAPEDTLKAIENGSRVTMRYVKPEGTPAQGLFPFNPNGSMNDIASICDGTGRIMGMMPHPERAIFFTQRDDWTFLKEKYIRENKEIPEESDGIMIFRNAVNYFS